MESPSTSRIDAQLSAGIRELNRIFRSAPSKREAHDRARPVLQDLSMNREVIQGLLRRYLAHPSVLNAGNYPVVGINIELNPRYHLVANCWIPLPGRETNVSTKAVHHHGNMLLTTVAVHGPGYDHWLFTPPTVIDPTRELYTMKLEERKRHALHDVAFVDAWWAHVPVYPERLSITLCLWSHQFPTTWKDYVKRIPVLKYNEDVLRRMSVRMGLARHLDLKMVRYFDFYPTDEGFRGMRERTEFPFGPNADHLCSVFHILQETGNATLAPLVEARLNSGFRFTNRPLISRLLGDLRRGRPIEARLSESHFGLTHATFTTDAIERALAATQSPSVIHGR